MKQTTTKSSVKEKTTRHDLVDEINRTFNLQNKLKFEAGQREHGGDFERKPTVENVREEAVDLINYTHILALHKDELVIELGSLMDYCDEHRDGIVDDDMDELISRVHSIIWKAARL